MIKKEFEMSLILLGFVTTRKYADGNFRYELGSITVWLYNKSVDVEIMGDLGYQAKQPYQRTMDRILNYLDMETTINDS